MNDKTCGTCSHGLRNIVYCEKTKPNANTSGLRAPDWAASKRYSERTDSVEQVARDMLKEINALISILETGRMRKCFYDEPRDRLIERLKALGVEV